MQKLTSSRLYFRPLTQDDATERYAGWLNDPLVNKYLSIRNSSHSVESCRQFIAAMNEEKNNHLFGIFLNDDDQHIGNIKLGSIDETHAEGHLGVLIGERLAWGKGYATEAIRCITQYGFDTLGLEQIKAGCGEYNHASLRAFLKAGYLVEGRQRFDICGISENCFLLAATKSEWRASSE